MPAATASTTVVGPLTASPAKTTPGRGSRGAAARAPIATITASRSARVCSLPMTSTTRLGWNVSPPGRATLRVRMPRTAPRSARTAATRVRPETWTPARNNPARSLSVSGISESFSRANSSTWAAPAAAAVSAQSAATAPPPITATRRPATPFSPRSARNAVHGRASSSPGMPRRNGCDSPVATTTAA